MPYFGEISFNPLLGYLSGFHQSINIHCTNFYRRALKLRIGHSNFFCFDLLFNQYCLD